MSWFKKSAADIMAEAVERNIKEEEKTLEEEKRREEQKILDAAERAQAKQQLTLENEKKSLRRFVNNNRGNWILGEYKWFAEAIKSYNTYSENRIVEPLHIIASQYAFDGKTYLHASMTYLGIVGKGSRYALFEINYLTNFKSRNHIRKELQIPEGKIAVYGLYYPWLPPENKNAIINITINQLFTDGSADITAKLRGK